jgi:hypothetical protein
MQTAMKMAPRRIGFPVRAGGGGGGDSPAPLNLYDAYHRRKRLRSDREHHMSVNFISIHQGCGGTKA